jgi:hypothetical protein
MQTTVPIEDTPSGARFAIGCAALAATAIGVMLIWGPWLPTPAPLLGYDGTPIPSAVNDPSAPARVRRYQLFVGGLALVALGLALLPRGCSRAVRGPGPGATRALERATALILGAAAVAVTGVSLRATMPDGTLLAFFAGFYGALIHPSPRFLAGAVLAGVIALPLLVRAAPRLPRRAWWTGLAALGVGVTLPGLFQPLVLVHTPPEIIRTIEWHYDSVLGGAFTLLAGDRERHLGYGYLLSVVKALGERVGGPFTFAADVRLVQGTNVLFALALVWAGRAWDRARPLPALLTLALVLPWVHNNHQGIFFPNQSGLRYIAIPLALVLLRWSHRLAPRHAAPALGAFAALALLWNLETGVAVTAAIVVQLVVRSGPLLHGGWLSPALHFGGGIIAASVLVGLQSGVGLGVWPLEFGIPRKLIERTTAGLGYGYPLYLDLLAILVFGCAIWAVLDLAWAWRSGAPDARTIDSGALGVLTLIWAPYYVLQPNPWNVWSYLIPGGFLLGERLFPPGPRPPWLRVPVALAVTIAVPAVAAGAWQTWQSLERGTALASVAALDAQAIGRSVSGVMVTTPDARAIEARAAHLATVPAGTVVLTGNTYLLPRLTGRTELFPYRDLAYAGTLRSQLDDLVASIVARAPSRILVDDPATLSRTDLHRAYFHHLETALAARYRREGVQAGWSVWTKVPAP